MSDFYAHVRHIDYLYDTLLSANLHLLSRHMFHICIFTCLTNNGDSTRTLFAHVAADQLSVVQSQALATLLSFASDPPQPVSAELDCLTANETATPAGILTLAFLMLGCVICACEGA